MEKSPSLVHLPERVNDAQIRYSAKKRRCDSGFDHSALHADEQGRFSQPENKHRNHWSEAHPSCRRISRMAGILHV